MLGTGVRSCRNRAASDHSRKFGSDRLRLNRIAVRDSVAGVLSPLALNEEGSPEKRARPSFLFEHFQLGDTQRGDGRNPSFNIPR